MAWKRYTGNKYGSRKVEVNGIMFDSKREAARYQELLLLEKAGDIYKTILPDGDTITIVEDTKGFRTKDYIIKRKLMLSTYGIQIREI